MRSSPPSILTAIALSSMLAGATTHAAPDAGAKASGDFNYYGHSAHCRLPIAPARFSRGRRF
jgi:hypothetical protein